jgi:hypothetical protein
MKSRRHAHADETSSHKRQRRRKNPPKKNAPFRVAGVIVAGDANVAEPGRARGGERGERAKKWPVGGWLSGSIGGEGVENKKV